MRLVPEIRKLQLFWDSTEEEVAQTTVLHGNKQVFFFKSVLLSNYGVPYV